MSVYAVFEFTSPDGPGERIVKVYASRDAAEAKRARLYYGGRVVEVPMSVR